MGTGCKNDVYLPIAAALFSYDPETGNLFYKIGRGKRIAGSLVKGWVDKWGYLSVSVRQRGLFIHRIAFYIVNGFCSPEIDHIDGDPKNNKISNLRASSQRLNSRNRKINRSGRLVGTDLHNGRWRARYRVPGGRRVHLGYFDTEREGHDRYMEEVRKYE